MQLYYYQDEIGNFGDDINPWLWPKLTSLEFDDDPAQLFVGIGTLLNYRLPATGTKIIMGSGLGYGAPPQVDDSYDFVFVRGRATAEQLSLPAELAITDPAIMVADVWQGEPATEIDVAYMPHHKSALDADWRRVAGEAGLHYIDPANPDIERTIAEIAGARVLVTEALHGGVVADALGTPWVPVLAYDHIVTSKWHDWCESLGLSYVPHRLTPIFDADRDNPRRALKNRLKRALRTLGLGALYKDRPPPARTSESLLQGNIAALRELAESAQPLLSDRELSMSKRAQIRELIHKVEQTYAG